MQTMGCSWNKGAAAERILIERAQFGDEVAFTEILQRYKRPVLKFLYRMTGDSEVTRDLAQEVFIRVWLGLGRFRARTDAAFSTWLFQIARNIALDFRRRHDRHSLRTVTVDPHILETVPATTGSIVDNLGTQEIGSLVAAAIAKLPQDQRTVVILAEYEGLSYKKIATVMRCSAKAVESRLYRARQALRRGLADRCSAYIRCDL